jgi:hypothetical protein
MLKNTTVGIIITTTSTNIRSLRLKHRTRLPSDASRATLHHTFTQTPMAQDSAELNIATEHVTNQHLLRSDTLRIQVEFDYGWWWEMPQELYAPLLQKYREDYEEASFVWDWGNIQWALNGETTRINRYVINFRTMIQRNTDTERTRRVRFVHIIAEGA